MGSHGRGDPTLSRVASVLRPSWDLLLLLVFAIGSARSLIVPILEPGIIGSHAVIYTDAARAWLTGGNPWTVGPPDVVFAGPPPMLLPFVPFVFMPDIVIRVAWVAGMAALAVWLLRRLRMPGYWIGFPPLFGAIVLGHPEVLVLSLLVVGGTASGLAAVIKPYAGFALLAERRWRAIVVGGAIGLASLVVLPWQRFIDELPRIGANIVRQSLGDSVFGDPALMAVAVVALAALGLRHGLWLVAPVMWPSAQPMYKVMSIPFIPPILAVAWSSEVPGATLVGIVVLAALTLADRRRALPSWLSSGVRPRSTIAESSTAPDAPGSRVAVASGTRPGIA